MAPERKPGRARWALAAAPLALLVLLELAARLVLGAPASPMIVTNSLQRPERYFTTQGDQVLATYDSGAASFAAHSPRPRLVFLGGSSVSGGSRLNPGQEFPDLVASKLALEPLNLAGGGRDSQDAVGILGEALAWSPVGAVLYLGHNDYGNLYFRAHFDSAWESLTVRARSSLHQLWSFALLRRAITRENPRITQPGAAQTGGAKTLGDHKVDPAQVAKATLQLAANLERAHDLLRAAGLPMILVLPVSDLSCEPLGSKEPEALAAYQQGMALRHQDPAQGASLLRRARDLDWVTIRAHSDATTVMRRLAEAHPEVVLVDTQAHLLREPGLDIPASDLFSDCVHLSVSGHQAMAELIAEGICRAGLLPGIADCGAY